MPPDMQRPWLLVIAWVLFAGGQAAAQPLSATRSEAIQIGNIAPMTGPAAGYGALGRAIGAYFKQVNDDGGINGRRVVYIEHDDGYAPAKTRDLAQYLVEKQQALLIVAPVGMAANLELRSYTNENKVPQLFAISGAARLGDPKNFPWTMAWPLDFRTEGRFYARYLLKAKPQARIGILVQDDAYWQDFREGFKEGLGEAGRKRIVAEQTYQLTDGSVDAQVLSLKQSGADAFFNIAAPKFAAQAIRKAGEIGWQPLHIVNSVSASVSAVLERAGLEHAQGLITSFYRKDPDDPAWAADPAMKAWRAWMARYNPAADVHDGLNVEGYLVGQALTQVLQQCGDDLSPENVMRQAANLRGLALPMLLPGIAVDTSPSDYAPIQAAQLARFEGQRWKRFGEVLRAE
jgi:ABC-type branched-subunit amino acid transport system substrate-binding protein